MFKALTFPKHSIMFITTLGWFTVGRLMQGDMGPGHLYLILTGALIAFMAFQVKEESRHNFHMFHKMRTHYFMLATRVDETFLLDSIIQRLDIVDVVFQDDPQQILQQQDCRFTYRTDTSDTLHEGVLTFDGEDLYLRSAHRTIIFA